MGKIEAEMGKLQRRKELLDETGKRDLGDFGLK